MMHEIVFLFDVDNTLLNNDRVQADLDVHIGIEHGTAARNRYWEIFEALRSELGYADYLGALERYRLEDLHDPRLLRMSNWLDGLSVRRSAVQRRVGCGEARHSNGRLLSSCRMAMRCSSPARWSVTACGRRSTAMS